MGDPPPLPLSDRTRMRERGQARQECVKGDRRDKNAGKGTGATAPSRARSLQLGWATRGAVHSILFASARFSHHFKINPILASARVGGWATRGAISQNTGKGGRRDGAEQGAARRREARRGAGWATPSAVAPNAGKGTRTVAPNKRKGTSAVAPNTAEQGKGDKRNGAEHGRTRERRQAQ